jgi:tetratricopeptide (TPR) repeat protein
LFGSICFDVFGRVGLSLFPLISTAFKDQSSNIATPSSATQAAQEKPKLEDQARGYSLVLQREPENQTALQGLVQTRIQLGDLEGAIAPLSKLVELNPNQTEVRLVLGQVYATQKRYLEAIAVYDEATKADPQDFRPVLAKAGILKQQGKTEQAKSLFESAAALAPAQYKNQINSLATEATTPAPSSTPEVKTKE